MQITIEKKHFWMFTVIALVLVGLMGTIFVIAAKGDPSTSEFGHNIVDIDGLKARLDDLDIRVAGGAAGGGAAGAASGVPSKWCIFSATESSCPDGFDTPDIFAEKTIRGVGPQTRVGATGGRETLASAFNCWGDNDCGGRSTLSTPGDNWPPYIGVKICCKR